MEHELCASPWKVSDAVVGHFGVVFIVLKFVRNEEASKLRFIAKVDVDFWDNELEKFLQASTSTFPDPVDLLIQLLQILPDESLIEFRLICTQIRLDLLVRVYNDSNVRFERVHCLLPNPATHITSSVNCIIIKTLIERFQNLNTVIFWDLLDAEGLDHLNQRADGLPPRFCVIRVRSFWHAICKQSAEEAGLEELQQSFREPSECHVVASCYGDVRVVHRGAEELR